MVKHAYSKTRVFRGAGVWTCILVAAIGAEAYHQPLRQTPTEEQARTGLTDNAAAVARARSVVGIPSRIEVDGRAELIILESDDTPFLSANLLGRQIWHVVLRDVRIELASTPEDVVDPHRRVFDIYLDPDNGRLLKMASRWPEGVPPLPVTWTAESATERIMASGREVWHGFPEGGPQTTFFQALDEIQAQGGGGPSSASQIVAHYVLISKLNHPTPAAVWSIHLRGTPPLVLPQPPGASERPGPRHLRSVVDDASGKFVYMTTAPEPSSPPAKALVAPADDKPLDVQQTPEKRK